MPTEPNDHAEIEKILARSAANKYRIIDTIAAVVANPLFRTSGKQLPDRKQK